MDKLYQIKIGKQLIGLTRFEKADAPMGVVFGEIISKNVTIDYNSIKTIAKQSKANITYDYEEDELISIYEIPNLKIISPTGIEIKGLGHEISGMNEEGFEITILGIPYPFYEEEFPHHVEEYRKLHA